MDLFETPELLPIEVRNKELVHFDNTYEECRKLLEKVESLGYTFEYGLDGIPYNLSKIV